MSVLGFDIGNENCVIAAVKQKGIDVLLNDESKRETPAMVSFGEKQRFLGSAGAACATMNPKSTISQVKRLIGRSFDRPDVQDDLRLFPYETSKGPDGGILIHLHYLGERHTFTPVQILAMLFSHLKQIAEKNSEIQSSDCVIGIPSYFTDLQRRQYLNAAAVAGLKPLRLMHDCTATALGYGIYKTDFSNSGQSHVVFVDIGHSDTQVSAVLFEPRRMKMLSHAFDSNLGARDFDEILFCHFARQFKDQYDIDVYASARACIRLRAACEKLKKVLSANPEAPLHIECLVDEKDVKGYITRDEFEKLSSSLLDRISIPCQKALSDAGVTVEKIQSVELVGSGSRIPAVTRVLASIFRREPRRTLNASECVALGCALQCAMLSPNFRVTEYEVEDFLPFSIGFYLPDDDPIQALPNGVLFCKGRPIPSDKMLTLHKSSTFLMEAFYDVQTELPPGVSPKISKFTIGPFEVPHTVNAKVKVKACLTLHGTITLASASLVGQSRDAMAIRKSGDMSTERVEAVSDSKSPDAENSAEDRYSTHPKPVSAVHGNDRKGKSIMRFDIPINEVVYGGISQAELLEAQEKEAQLANQDNKVEQAKEKKNTLESYVYETRNKIMDTFRDFSTASEKEVIIESLQRTEDWLYEEGDAESANVYAERLQGLKMLVHPIENRCKEEEARAHATRDLFDSIDNYEAAATSAPATVRDAVLAECSKTEQWIIQKIQEQNSQPKNADPVVWSNDIERKAEDLHAMCRYLMSWNDSTRKSEYNAYADHSSRRDDMQVD